MNLMGKPRAQRSCRRMRNEVFDVEIKCWRDGEHHCTTFVCILLHINTDALTSGWEEKMQRCVVPKAPVSRPRRRSHASRPRSCPPRLFSPPPQSRPAPRGCPPSPPPQSRPRGCPPSPCRAPTTDSAQPRTESARQNDSRLGGIPQSATSERQLSTAQKPRYCLKLMPMTHAVCETVYVVRR